MRIEQGAGTEQGGIDLGGIDPGGIDPGGVGQIDWGGFLEKGIDTASDIFTTRWGQPPAGTYIQTDPSGAQTLIRATEGGPLPVIAGQAKLTADVFPPSMLPLLVAGGLFVVVMMTMRGGGGGRGRGGGRWER